MIGRAIDLLCLFGLLATVVAVLYGLILRTYFEHNYVFAVVIAGFGAIILLVGMVQQLIAARDAETWREMANWQLRAAHRKLNERLEGRFGPDLDNSPDYYLYLTEALIAEFRETETTENWDGAQ